MASVAFFVPIRKVMAKSELMLVSPETIDFGTVANIRGLFL